MITILIVDDHRLVRIGLRRLLGDIKGIKVVGEAGNGEDAAQMVKDLKPDIVLMDIHMPGIGGLEATRKILRIAPKIKVIVVTVYGEEPFPSRLLKAGAAGYITKGASLDEMAQAIRTVQSGQRYLSPQVAQRLALKQFSDKEASPFDKLSERELQIMMLIVQGTKPHQIARKVDLSPKTVSGYRYRLFEKLKVESDVELTHLAIRYKIIEIDRSKIHKKHQS
jgi:two-component system invasion response regulator UvrY